MIYLFCKFVWWFCAAIAAAMAFGQFAYKADPENRVRSDKDVLIDSVLQ